MTDIKPEDTPVGTGLEQFFREKREMLVRLAFYSVRDKSVAEDIVGNAFVKLWQMKDEMPVENLPGYCCTVVKNMCLNWRRDTGRHKAAHDKLQKQEMDLMEYYSSVIESCDPTKVFTDEIMSICRKRLQELPEQLSDTYIKSRIEGMTYKEIAEAMNIPLRKVNRNMTAVIKELRDALSDYVECSVILALLGMPL